MPFLLYNILYGSIFHINLYRKLLYNKPQHRLYCFCLLIFFINLAQPEPCIRRTFRKNFLPCNLTIKFYCLIDFLILRIKFTQLEFCIHSEIRHLDTRKNLFIFLEL